MPATVDPSALARRRVGQVILVGTLIGLAAAVVLTAVGIQHGVFDSLEALQTYINSRGVWGPLAFFAFLVSQTVVPIGFGGVMVVSAPLLFGSTRGVIIAYLAVCLGSIINFSLARRYGLMIISNWAKPRAAQKYLNWTRSNQFTRLFALAIAFPVAPDDYLCYVAGTSRMRARTFLIILLTCKPWSLIAYSLGISTLLLKFIELFR